MAINSSKNHFPDWLFYFASIALVAFIFLYFGGREKQSFLKSENEKLSQQFLILKDTARNLDSTISETKKKKNQAIDDFNNLIERQGNLTIENYGEESSIIIDDFRVVYFDESVDSFKHFRGMLDKEIAPKSACALKLVKDGETVWNGQVLFYSLIAREYFKPDEAGGLYETMGPKIAYFFGTWEKGKTLRINLDGFNNLDESRAKKIVDYCK